VSRGERCENDLYKTVQESAEPVDNASMEPERGERRSRGRRMPRPVGPARQIQVSGVSLRDRDDALGDVRRAVARSAVAGREVHVALTA